ncbi:hypothetical protein DICVIV_00735 [Dictyocaulus viviparus]|uniref:Uncharacterized protein n=1 Tax=Dictyocaulus viviparus TaxID=29172 RepID=A0A0D8Y8J8_DICVI|nr:hypothetical protein DICVIV_00735 [Dictyocaulus viviparus]
MLNLVVQQCQTKHTFILVHLKTVMMILDHISRPVPLSHRKIAYFNGILKYLSSKSNDAEDETEEDFSRNSSSTEESCSQRNVYESCIPSPSSINSNRPRLRSMSRLSKKQEEKNIELPTKLSRQSQMDSLSHGKRNAEQCLSSTDQLREQESIQRRKSLRSWSGKSKKEDGGNATQNCTTKDMSEIPSINVQSLRSHSDAGMSKTKSRSRVEISDSSVGNSSADEASFLSNGKRRRVLSRSESKNYQKPDLSSCKNRGNVAEKCSREVRLLRSLNMKDVNKSVDNSGIDEYIYSIDNSAIDKEGDRLKEFRILRSRSSFPPMEPVHKERTVAGAVDDLVD